MSHWIVADNRMIANPGVNGAGMSLQDHCTLAYMGIVPECIPDE
jgi:hypothetical protein